MYIYFVSKFVLNAMLFRIYIVHIVEMFLFLTWLNLYNLHKRYYWYSFNRFIWKWYYFLLKVCQKIMRNLAVIVDCIWGDFEIQSWRIRRISRFSELRISNFFSEIFRTLKYWSKSNWKPKLNMTVSGFLFFSFRFFFCCSWMVACFKMVKWTWPPLLIERENYYLSRDLATHWNIYEYILIDEGGMRFFRSDCNQGDDKFLLEIGRSQEWGLVLWWGVGKSLYIVSRRVLIPLFNEEPLYIAYPLLQFLSNPPPPYFPVNSNPHPYPPTVLSAVLFLWLNGWSHHVWCAILLNDNMDIHMSTLGTVVPEEPWCVFYATRRHVYWGLTHNVIFYWYSDLMSHTQTRSTLRGW